MKGSLSMRGEGNFTRGYFGGMMDASTGLLYVGNGQYYDPATGRFLTREAQSEKTNPYILWSQGISGVFLAPLVLAMIFTSRKRRKDQTSYLVILCLVAIYMGVGVTACEEPNWRVPTGLPTLPQATYRTPLIEGVFTPTIGLMSMLHDRYDWNFEGNWAEDEIRTIANVAKLDLLVLDNRFDRASALVATQDTVPDGFSRFLDPALADEILDNLAHNAYRLSLTCDSRQKVHSVIPVPTT
jgi:hypothetical protein